MSKPAEHEKLAASLSALTAVASILPFPSGSRATLLLTSTVFGTQAFKTRGAALILPLIAVATVDLFLGGHQTTLWTYFGILAAYAVIKYILRRHRSPTRVASAIVLCCPIFFILSNGPFLTIYWECIGADYSADQALLDVFLLYLKSLPADLIISAAIFLIYELMKDLPRGNVGKPSPQIHAG